MSGLKRLVAAWKKCHGDEIKIGRRYGVQLGTVAPFPYFGGKSNIAAAVWARLGEVKHYVEPFCGSAAMLLAAPKPASLEVICDVNGFIANFWRAVKCQPDGVVGWADYPVSHVDLGARHQWLMDHKDNLAELQDAEWPGDARIAGWWLWGQCCWIGSGWCDWNRNRPQKPGQIPHTADAGRGIQAIGQIPHSHPGKGVQSASSRSREWISALSARLARVRIIHGSWDRCLNLQYGLSGNGRAAVFLDPPYLGYEKLYGTQEPTAKAVEAWAREHVGPRTRIALCGHAGDYDLPGWTAWAWSRVQVTMGSEKTRNSECVWFSPACL
jgi:DNA adenine methylase